MEKTIYPEYSKHYPALVKNFMKRPLYLYPDDEAMVYRNNNGMKQFRCPPDRECYRFMPF